VWGGGGGGRGGGGGKKWGRGGGREGGAGTWPGGAGTVGVPPRPDGLPHFPTPAPLLHRFCAAAHPSGGDAGARRRVRPLRAPARRIAPRAHDGEKPAVDQAVCGVRGATARGIFRACHRRRCAPSSRRSNSGRSTVSISFTVTTTTCTRR